MSRTIRTIAASLAALAVGASLAAGPAPAEATPLYPTSHKAQAHPHKVDRAEAWYYTHLGPSKAWRNAGKAERANARRAYRWASEGAGCMADLKHAYQGKTGHGGLHNVRPWLPVERVFVPGRDIYLAEYTDGICGE